MNFIFLIVVFICFYRTKFYGKGFNTDYLSKTSTTCVNGVFVFLVFLSHFRQYIEYGPYDKIFKYIISNIGQYMVVTFLFYSGYGIMYSIRKKGQSYVKALPYHRLLKVWMHFALAVLVFYCADLLCHKRYAVSRLLLSMIGWESIGNSNWFVFCVLIMYIATVIAFLLTSKLQTKYKDTIAVSLIVLSCVLFVLILRPFKDEYWFNTAIAYPLGMLYFLYEDKIRKLVQKNNILYVLACITMLVLLYGANQRKQIFVVYELSVIWVMALILLFTMKCSINNKILLWMGKHTFEIYILQRIPMMMLQNHISNTYVYFGLSFVITLAIAVLFRMLTDKIDAHMYAR